MSRFADDKILERAVMQYSGMITRIAFQHTRNKADAEDIAQDVFFSLIKQPPFETEVYLKAWLVRAAINKSRDYLRSAKRRNAAALNEEYALTERDDEVFDALQRLPVKDRNILYLFYYEGYTAKEIADIIGKKEGAVAMRLTRARENLKTFLEERQ